MDPPRHRFVSAPLFALLLLLRALCCPEIAQSGQILPRWALDLPGPASSTPFLAEDRVWLALGSGILLGVDPDTGEELARIDLHQSELSGSVVYGADRVWWSEPDGVLASLSLAREGTLPIRIQLAGTILGEPVFAGRDVYVLTENALHRLGGENPSSTPEEIPLAGRPCGRLAFGASRFAIPVCSAAGEVSIQLLEIQSSARSRTTVPIQGQIAGIAVNQDFLVVALEHGDWQGYRLRPGNRRLLARRAWRRKSGLSFNATPLLWGNRAVVVGLDNWMQVVKAKDGNLLRRIRLPYQTRYPPAWLPGGRLAMSMRGMGSVVRADIQTGLTAVLWQTDRSEQLMHSGPAVDQRRGLLVVVEGPWAWRLLGFPTEPIPTPDGSENPLEAGEAVLDTLPSPDDETGTMPQEVLEE